MGVVMYMSLQLLYMILSQKLCSHIATNGKLWKTYRMTTALIFLLYSYCNSKTVYPTEITWHFIFILDTFSTKPTICYFHFELYFWIDNTWFHRLFINSVISNVKFRSVFAFLNHFSGYCHTFYMPSSHKYVKHLNIQ